MSWVLQAHLMIIIHSAKSTDKMSKLLGCSEEFRGAKPPEKMEKWKVRSVSRVIRP